MDEAPEYLDRLTKMRGEIDQVDREILRLLNRRAEMVLAIRALKAGQNVPLYAPWREEEILERLKALNPGPLYDQVVEKIFRTILKGSLELVEEAGGGI